MYNMRFIGYTLNIIEWFGVIVKFQKNVNSFSRVYTLRPYLFHLIPSAM